MDMRLTFQPEYDNLDSCPRPMSVLIGREGTVELSIAVSGDYDRRIRISDDDFDALVAARAAFKRESR